MISQIILSFGECDQSEPDLPVQIYSFMCNECIRFIRFVCKYSAIVIKSDRCSWFGFCFHLFSVIKGICFSALARMRKMEKESEQELVRLHVGLPAILVTSSGKAGSGESSDHLETQTSTFDKSQTEVGRSEGTKLIYSKKQNKWSGSFFLIATVFKLYP